MTNFYAHRISKNLNTAEQCLSKSNNFRYMEIEELKQLVEKAQQACYEILVDLESLEEDDNY